MLIPDLTFHLPMVLVDLLAVAFLLSQRTKRRFLTVVLACLAITGFLTVLLADAVNRHFGFRVFGLLRFLGHAGAFHLPLLLATAGILFRRDRAVSRAAWAGALLLVLIAGYAYQIEPRHLEVTHHALRSERLGRLERPVTILQVADIQTDRIGAYERRVARAVRELQPDLVVFLGDYLQVGDAAARNRLVPEFNRLFKDPAIAAPLGAYAIQGDCERWDGWEALFEGTGIEVLRNETRVIALPGASLNLIALDVNSSRGRSPGEIQRIAGAKDANGLDVYIGHSPDFADQLASGDQPFLALAGHTHGGQVRIPFWGAPITFSRLPRRMADAFARFGPGILSVSRGVGMERIEAPRARLFCRPELRMVTLMPSGGSGEGSSTRAAEIEIAGRSEADGPKDTGLTATREVQG